MDTLITLMDIIPAVMEEGFQEVGEKVGETVNPLDGGDEGVSCKGEGWSEMGDDSIGEIGEEAGDGKADL
ncbi:hypothetical protein M8J77_019437 [Diaphorina citri]|nr:hypothetical protein M8J77_019437 [Diaphorina citri]